MEINGKQIPESKADLEARRRQLYDAAEDLRAARPEAAANAGGFRVVITGKGGVGKTTLTAVLARLLARDGYTVLAIDADPQMNLAYSLGLPPDEAGALVPLSHNLDYVEEKTGARPGAGYGLFFKLNPDVSDVVERFGVVGPDGVQCLVMGSLIQPAAGCLCPENTLLAATVNALNLRQNEAILMDTQAGVEHFGRALARGFHQAVVVADPTFNAIQVALQTARLADGLGIRAVHLAVNRVRRPGDLERTLERVEAAGGFDFHSRYGLPHDEAVMDCEPAVSALFGADRSPFMQSVRALRAALVRAEQELAE